MSKLVTQPTTSDTSILRSLPYEEYLIPLAIVEHPAGRKMDSVTFMRLGDKTRIKRNISAEFIFKNNVVEEIEWEE